VTTTVTPDFVFPCAAAILTMSVAGGCAHQLVVGRRLVGFLARRSLLVKIIVTGTPAEILCLS